MKDMHLRRLITVSIGVLGMAFVLTGCGRNTMATVNGEKITRDEFYGRLERVPTGGGQAGPVILNELIQERLWQQLAKDEGVTPREEQIKKRIEWQQKAEDLAFNLRRQGVTLGEYKKALVAQQAQANVLIKHAKISDKEVRAFYDRYKNQQPFTRPARTRIAIIMTRSRPAIDKAYKTIEDGTDFSRVAGTMSEDRVSSGNGGELGWVWRGMKDVPKLITDTASELKDKGVSEPFSMPGGQGKTEWYILKALRKQPRQVINFEDSKEWIRERLARAKPGNADTVSQLVVKSFAGSKISITPARYKGLQRVLEQNQKAAKKAKTTGNKKL